MQKNNCCNTKMLLKDFSSMDKITLPCSCPPIKEILDFSAKLCITNNKIIKTITRYTLIIKGYNLIKIRYLSYDCRGKVMVKKLISPFFITIQIPPYFNIINVKADISYSDIDNCDSSILFYSIISVCLSMSFTPAKSIVNCLNSGKCCDDLNFKDNLDFKNDSYPSKTNYCYSKRDTYKEDCQCFNNEIFSTHNDHCNKDEYSYSYYNY
ncbi:hypothetical protein UT300005_28020 [Clostridium sp. CTA-5]